MKRIASIVAMIGFVFAVGLSCFNSLIPVAPIFPRPNNHTQEILSAADDPEDPDVRLCGDWLPQIIFKNHRQHNVTIKGIWGDYASPIPGGTGTDAAIVYVDFPDGSRIRMEYYADTLTVCRLVRVPDDMF